MSMLLRPKIPPGWEEEMEAAGLVLEDDEDVERDRDKLDDEDISVESVSSDKN